MTNFNNNNKNTNISFKSFSNLRIDVETTYIWKKRKFKTGFIYYTGSKDLIEKLEKLLNESFKLNKIKKFLLINNRNSSVIIQTGSSFLAFTSFSRDHPIFFRIYKSKLLISNSIKKIIRKSESYNNDSLLEFALSGYCLGNKTLINGIHSIGPANIIWGDSNSLNISKYFSYHKTLSKNNKKSFKDYFYTINNIIDDSINYIIENSNDKTIYVPLSGGLDSRLIIAKFHEKKYKNIKSFSYGLKNNSDALIAKKVADHLDVKWDYIWFDKAKFRKLYFSEFKKKYDNFSDHLSCIPNYAEIFFLNSLKEKKYFSKNPILVNGQSGDFNTGLHIPKILFDQDRKDKDKNLFWVLEAIRKKHFCLWLQDDLKLNNFKINEKIKNSLDVELLEYPLSDIYENWEYRERQSKFVVNGQRAYEFLNFDWFLPLWDSEFVKFWTTVPLELRYKQNLYKRYLLNWNYKDIFEIINDDVTAFTGYKNIGIMALSFSLNFLVNKEIKQKIINISDYFSRYGFQYQFFSFFEFLKKRKKVKNAVGMHVRRWLQDKILLDKVYIN